MWKSANKADETIMLNNKLCPLIRIALKISSRKIISSVIGPRKTEAKTYLKFCIKNGKKYDGHQIQYRGDFEAGFAMDIHQAISITSCLSFVFYSQLIDSQK